MLRIIYRSLGGSRVGPHGQNTEQQNTTHTYTHDTDSDDSYTTTPSAPPLAADSPPPRRLTRAEAMERLRELLECSICLEELNDPRVLPCHHSFCLPCLQKIHIGGGRVFRCPNCNKEVQLRRGMSELPTDFRANALRECLPGEDGDEVAAAGDTQGATTALPAFNTSNTVMGMVTCPVCEEMLTEPRRLDCGHSFCLGCLEFMMPMTGSILHCPCCAGQTVVQEGVEALPVDAAKSHMMEMFSPPSIAAEDTTTPPSLYPDLSQEVIPGYEREPTLLLAPPQPNTDNADRPRGVLSITLTFLQDISTQLQTLDTGLQTLDTALRRVNTSTNVLTLLCLICFLGGVIMASLNWESGLLKLVVSVLAWFSPLFILAGVLMLVFGLTNGTVGDGGVHDRQKYGGWIGAIVGAEVFVYYSATTNYGLFCAVSGAVFGCVAICVAVLSSPNNETISSRSFIEGLALKTVPFVMLGGLHGAGIIDSILFGPSIFIGAFLGTLVSSHVLAFFARNNIRIELSKYNTFITLRGALLGNITSAVLLQLLHPRFGLWRCLISGAALGTGIGLIFGDIYLPWLRKLLGVSTDDVRPARAPSAEVRDPQKQAILIVGTLAGAVVGFVTTAQIFGVLIGAPLGLYFCEQGMVTLRIICSDVFKLYSHCAVGALVGTCVGLLIALGYSSPLWGPLLGVVIETGIIAQFL